LAVLEGFHPDERAEVFKVPHHGSPNADCPEVWRDLLKEEPFAILAPFPWGRGLPQEADIARSKSRTPHVYCTARLVAKIPKRDRPRKKVSGPRSCAVNKQVGHIRIRWSAIEKLASPGLIFWTEHIKLKAVDF